MQHIAVSIPPTSDNNRGMIRGVMDFVRQRPELRIRKQRAVPFVPLEALRRVDVRGAVCLAETDRQLQALASLPIPVVNVSLHRPPHPGVPVVHSDNRAVGRLAAEHLLACALDRFAFVGHFDWRHDALRGEGFCEAIRAAGHDVAEIPLTFEQGGRAAADANVDRDRLACRLEGLPHRVGVFAPHDEFAHDVMEILSGMGRRIPFDAAVIGVNDYRLVCETTDPPLSSIRQRARQIGFEAARLLLDLIAGGTPPPEPLLVPPGALVARRSTDYRQVDDDLVRAAIEFIQTRFAFPITAADVAGHVGVSRRTLDKRFDQALKMTTAAEILRVRMAEARRLLVSTTTTVMTIGLRCGYESASGFVRAFGEEAGTTPLEYRRRFAEEE